MINEQLRAAQAELDKQSELVDAEVREHGSKGQIWHPGMCAAWPDYKRALIVLKALKELKALKDDIEAPKP